MVNASRGQKRKSRYGNTVILSKVMQSVTDIIRATTKVF